MKFSDIKRFTAEGPYQVDLFLGKITSSIEWYKEDGLQLNPDFQRGHVWTESQQIAFVEYALKGGKVNPIYLNSPSWNSLVLNKGYDDFVCVDGLQRLTALLKFEANEIPAFGILLKDFEEKPRMMQGTIKININSLKTKEQVLNWYIELNEGGTPHTKEEINRVKNMLK